MIMAEMPPLPLLKIKRKKHWQFPYNINYARAHEEKAQCIVQLGKNAYTLDFTAKHLQTDDKSIRRRCPKEKSKLITWGRHQDFSSSNRLGGNNKDQPKMMDAVMFNDRVA